mgnify:CR=1 FL=1
MPYNGGMSEKSFTSLSGQLLVAMPGLTDSNFVRGVTLLCQHNDEGAVGLVINKAADFTFDKVLDQLDLDSDLAQVDRVPVLIGGPLQPERGFIVHPADDGQWESSHRIDGHWAITTSRDILAAMAAGEGPRHALLALGYAGWGAGQLEQELAENSWLTVSATSQILFDTEVDERWQAATRLMGFDSHQLSPHIGHA